MGFALVLEEKVLNVLSKGECVDKEKKEKKIALLCGFSKCVGER